jgi:hypothetical protein
VRRDTFSLLIRCALCRPYLAEMLAQVSGGKQGSWPWKVLDSVAGHPALGLSEYTMYSSWVLQNKPGAFKVCTH